MLLTTLHEYSLQHRLLADLHLQKRVIHLLIPLTTDGNLRSQQMQLLSQLDEKGKERPGQERLMPRFPGENNGGRAYFLAESSIAVLGRDKKTGDPIASDLSEGGNSIKAFTHFWEQIEQAYTATRDIRLAAILAFRNKYLLPEDGKITSNLPFVAIRANKNGKLEFVARFGLGSEDNLPLESATIGFSINGQPMTLDAPDDSLRTYWCDAYKSQAFTEEDDTLPDKCPNREADRATVCLVTGQTGIPIARSHKPKILKIPGLSSGGYIVSFAKAAPAFSSYGFKMGENSPVSEAAAASYALALNQLLADEDSHYNLGPVSVCFWSKASAEVSRLFSALLNKPRPEHVKDFLKSPFVGIEREVLRRERLYTAAFSGNAGRVVVRHWIDQTVGEAMNHFTAWWEDLQIINIYPELNHLPFAVPNLARMTLRQSKKHKETSLVGERIVQLYRAAIEGTELPISLLKPILDEFHTAIVKNDESDPKKKTYPFSQSRFALIKLILLRQSRQGNPNQMKGAFMPEVKLSETNDPAYNCGRLLAVLEALQQRASSGGHNGKDVKTREGPKAGIIERYYGRASTAPAQVLPLLLKLSRYHLSKLQKGTESDRKAAVSLERRNTEILANLTSELPGMAPSFPNLLTIEQQGIFALGFYQQKAFDLAQYRKFKASQGKEGEEICNDQDSDNTEELKTQN